MYMKPVNLQSFVHTPLHLLCVSAVLPICQSLSVTTQRNALCLKLTLSVPKYSGRCRDGYSATGTHRNTVAVKFEQNLIVWK